MLGYLLAALGLILVVVGVLWLIGGNLIGGLILIVVGVCLIGASRQVWSGRRPL